MKWIKTGITYHGDGSKEIRYETGSDLMVESRKRPIPHTNGIGSWMYTSYFLIFPDGHEKEFHRLSDAKEAAYNIAKEMNKRNDHQNQRPAD